MARAINCSDGFALEEGVARVSLAGLAQSAGRHCRLIPCNQLQRSNPYPTVAEDAEVAPQAFMGRLNTQRLPYSRHAGRPLMRVA